MDPYAMALPAYDNVILAFGGGDAEELADAVQESLSVIEQFTLEVRARLQEFERVVTVNPGDRAESYGEIESCGWRVRRGVGGVT